ncbi:MAG: MraY family glycosyltransferase [Planctomycetota bacterium]
MAIIEKLNYPHIGLFILSWFLVDRFIPLIIKFSYRFNLLDYPGGYKKHPAGIPYLGGVGIFLAVFFSIFSILRFEYFAFLKPLIWIVICTFVMMVVGIIDDIKKVNALIKLFILFLLTLFLYYNGVSISIFRGSFEFINVPLTLLWLAGVASAYNSIDNSDGICGGVTAIISFFLFLISWIYYRITAEVMWKDMYKILSYASITLCGATLGFLRYNFPPAKIFLGDNGSLSIGFFLGAVTILGIWSNTPLKAIFIPICLLAVPLFDITFTTILRVKNGWVKSIPEAIKWCGNDHLSHRLKKIVVRDAYVAYIIYGLAIFSCIVSLILSHPLLSNLLFYLIVILFFLLLFVFMILLDKVPVDISNSYK